MTVHDLLVALVTLLAVVAVTTTISRWLGIGSVLAMLVAGIAIGPFGFAIASDVERIRGVSELGVVLLLFAIGLEMEPRRLARRCDAVLMDLRGFAPANAGCLYEIGQLLDAMPLDRVVFLAHATTDAPFLRSTFARLWDAVPAGSPNRRLDVPVVRLFSIERASASGIDGLLRLLLAERMRDAATTTATATASA
jgi:hypothetical protein